MPTTSTSTDRPQAPTPTEHPSWCPPDVWPFDLFTTTVEGHRIVFTDHGPATTGPVLVFVHTGMWSFIFRDVIERLGTEFRCVTLDFPGHGMSPDPAGRELTLTDHRRVLSSFLAERGFGDIVLVLHDLGGPVGMSAALDHLDRIRGLVMANTFVWSPDGRGLRTMLRVVSSRTMTGIDRLTGLIPRMTATSGGVGRHLDRAAKHAFLAGMRQPRQTARFHRLMGDALDAEGLFDDAARAATALRDRPVLTIFGEKNDPFGFQDRHHELFPDHEGHVVTGGNHFPMMDDPDLFATAVADWLRAQA